MSMLSSQCDTLRVAADALEDEGVIPDCAKLMRDAADTIWELRNKLAGTVDKSEEIDKRTAELDFQIADNWRLTAVNESLKEQNAKLKEQVHWLKKGDVLHVLTDQEFADQQKREREMQASIAALEDENAKLDRIRRSLHADVMWLGGIIHRRNMQLAEVQGALERRNDENAKLRESVRSLLICIKHEECEESCPNYEPMYTDYGYEKNGNTVVESEYLGCCTVGLENCNSTLFDTDEYLRELGIEVES